MLIEPSLNAQPLSYFESTAIELETTTIKLLRALPQLLRALTMKSLRAMPLSMSSFESNIVPPSPLTAQPMSRFEAGLEWARRKSYAGLNKI